MKELSKTIVGRGEVKGYVFTQIENNGLGYIYEKRCIETNKISYEVFKRKENKYFDCISYPSSKSFGVWAWDVQNLPYAIEVLATFKEKIV